VSCPVCHTLLHADRLRELAARASELARRDDLAGARDLWGQSLELLPPGSHQHAVISTRVSELDAKITASKPEASAKPGGQKKGWMGIAATILGLVLLLGGKLKFLLLGLTKAKTFFSMFAFFGVYWSAYGWPLALGLVISIYIHEMGHVSELRKRGIGAGSPLFIPGIGALVMLRERITDPRVNAAIGLAGPIWGLGAGLAAYAVFRVTGEMIWAAIAQLTGFLNLFNLIPIWQLDGSRGFEALTRVERWAITVAIGAAYLISGQKLLLIVGAVAVWRCFQKQAGPGDTRAAAIFVGLIAVLSWLSTTQSV
jgi:Zn-dependent protease